MLTAHNRTGFRIGQVAGKRARSIYNDPRWRAIRADALERADWTCERCGRPSGRLDVHHKIAIADGGDPFPSLSGVEAICRRCHYGEHRTRPGNPSRDAWRKAVDALL